MLEPGKGPRACVGFEVGGVRYAFDIARVREVLRPLPLQALPHAPAAVSGVFDHRGEIVPIVDLRLRFGVSTSAASAPRWVIIRSAERLLGVIVDRMTEVFALEDAEQRELPRLGRAAGAMNDVVAAYAHAGGLTFLLDVDRVAQLAQDTHTRALTGGAPSE